MNPVDFPGANVVLGLNQPHYRPLPAHYDAEESSTLTCWELDEDEAAQVSKTRRVWVKQLVFGGRALPLFVQGIDPREFTCDEEPPGAMEVKMYEYRDRVFEMEDLLEKQGEELARFRQENEIITRRLKVLQRMEIKNARSLEKRVKAFKAAVDAGLVCVEACPCSTESMRQKFVSLAGLVMDDAEWEGE